MGLDSAFDLVFDVATTAVAVVWQQLYDEPVSLPLELLEVGFGEFLAFGVPASELVVFVAEAWCFVNVFICSHKLPKANPDQKHFEVDEEDQQNQIPHHASHDALLLNRRGTCKLVQADEVVNSYD